MEDFQIHTSLGEFQGQKSRSFDESLKISVVTVGALLRQSGLKLPVYQRPYKWMIRNVHQLLDDIFSHREKARYRLGTLVLHDDGTNLNIVDGQQRTITFILIIRALIEQRLPEVNNPKLRDSLKGLEETMFNPKFSNDISIENIRRNYSEIVRKVASFDEELIEFVLDHCEFIQFVLTDISEAFQFFDSQNARGKDLEPHDLLKAFHLREFSEQEQSQKRQVVETWEQMETSDLAHLFGEYLYRIRGWSRGNSARYFTKEEVDLFKGINIQKIKTFPYVEGMRIAHYFVDAYNSNYERNIDLNQKAFPFQMDQSILNGRRFFEMVSHYKHKVDDFLKHSRDGSLLDKNASDIFQIINDYDGMDRIGDRYIRMLFDSTLIYYIDKFGYHDISKAVERIFIWSYKLRLRHHSVQLASVDNYVRWESNFFLWIKEAVQPRDCLATYIEPLQTKKSTKTKKIEAKFRKLKYYVSE